MIKSPWLKYKRTVTEYSVWKGWEHNNLYLCAVDTKRWIKEHTGIKLVKAMDIRIHLDVKEDGEWDMSLLPDLAMYTQSWLYNAVGPSYRFDVYVEVK